ncbi:MAG: recombinase family protein [Anaerocolumna sp.]|jgi:DNA invertase Pin-like site-specific DNA recombinase|nr:recombinase family protein [Anaerocolumna sp.]
MLRVAAYARVSTDTSDQLNSLENQIAYFKKYITANTEWQYTGIYVDEGISGTSIKKRAGFRKMLEDGYSKKFDLLLTKEISRFARNTLDSISYTRKLKDLGIGIVFLNDGINTLDADAELRLTIMASIAQEESRKTSVRIKWGQKRSMEQGVVFGRDLLGYKVISGNLYIDVEEAETVKTIFHKFIYDKKGVYTIANELTLAGIPTALHKQEWHGNVILKILKNEKYCGDLIQKKTYTPNYLLQEKKTNTGQEDKVFIKNHHEPIIDREMFEKVQKELHKRSKVARVNDRHTNKYCFSGLIKCGICGCSYVVRKKTGKKGCEYRYWKCYEQVKHGKKQEFRDSIKGCDNFGISEEDLKELIMELIKKINMEEELVADLEKVNPLKVNNKKLSVINMYEKEKHTIIKKEERLLNLYLEGIIKKEEYITQKKNMEMRVAVIDQYIENIKLEERKALSTSRRNRNICSELADIKLIDEKIDEKEIDENKLVVNENAEEELVNKKLVNKRLVEEFSEVRLGDIKLVEERLVRERLVREKSAGGLVKEILVEDRIVEQIIEEAPLDKGLTNYYQYLINIIKGKQYSETFVKNLINSIIIYENYISIKLNHMPEPFIIKRIME